MMLSNRSNGVVPPGSSPGGITKVDCFGILIEFSVSLGPDALGWRETLRIPSQLLIGQASASHAAQDFREPASITRAMLALVIAECLFIQIAEQVKRLDADLGSLQAALQERPEVFDAVSVDVSLDVLFGVIHELVNVILFESGVRCQFVSEETWEPAFDVCAHFFLQRATLAIRDVFHAHLAGFAIQQAHDQFFVRSASARYLLCFLVFVHIAGKAADHSLVGFD